MRTVNRSALIVRPREPYQQWVSGLNDGSADMTESIREECSVYLVSPDPREEEESAPIDLYYKRIFALELEAWHTDPSQWPPVRDYPTFKQWFDVEAQSIVADLESSRLLTEEI